MPNDDEDYELMPHRAVAKIKHELEILKRKSFSGSQPVSGDVRERIDKLNENINNLLSLFKEAALGMQDEAVDPLSKRIDQLEEENRQIAQGILVIADMIKELKEEKTSMPPFFRPASSQQMPQMPRQQMPQMPRQQMPQMPRPQMPQMPRQQMPRPQMPPMPPRMQTRQDFGMPRPDAFSNDLGPLPPLSMGPSKLESFGMEAPFGRPIPPPQIGPSPFPPLPEIKPGQKKEGMFSKLFK